MKLQTRDIEKFLSAPPPTCRVFLFYGPDQGLAQSRARALAAKLVPDIHDPFAVTLLDASDLAKDPARLTSESNTLALGAAQRLVWLRAADDDAAKAVEGLLLAGDVNAFVVIEGDDLPPKSALRKLCEAAQTEAAAIPCYVEDAGQIAQLVTRELAQAGWKMSRDAAQWFGQNLGGDRGLVQHELQKLITYLGKPTADNSVDLDTLRAIAAGGAVLEEDVFIDAVGTPAAVPMAQKLIAEGQPVPNLIRTLGRHIGRLYATQLKIQSGDDMKSAMESLQPKIFFKRENAFRAQLQKYSLRYLSRLRSELWRLERECKHTGTPDELLFSQLVLLLTR
jgi:DNA polymerase-3 subunit delta